MTTDHNSRVNEELRANNGKSGGNFEGAPLRGETPVADTDDQKETAR